VNLRDNRFQSTALDWALFAWAKADDESRERGYELTELLVEAGAKVHVPWLEPNTAEQVRTDPRMQQILRGAIVMEGPDTP
jgi:hypothetical protein